MESVEQSEPQSVGGGRESVGGSMVVEQSDPQSVGGGMESVGGSMVVEQSDPQSVGGGMDSVEQSDPQSVGGGMESVGGSMEVEQSDPQSDIIDGGSMFEQYWPQLDEMDDHVGGLSEIEVALWQSENADATDAGEVESTQLQPLTSMLFEPMEVPEKPKSWKLGVPSELHTWLMRLATWVSYTTERDETRRISSEKLWSMPIHCESTMVCVSTSQIEVRMTSFAYSVMIASCCWMTVMSTDWHVTVSVCCSMTWTLEEPQKLSLPNHESKPEREDRPPQLSNECDDEKLETLVDEESKISLSMENTGTASPKLKSPPPKEPPKELPKDERFRPIGLAATDEARTMIDAERTD
jgi:hypothetical protein